jgi:glycosyltransferase involved in cell wall biosynthesis
MVEALRAIDQLVVVVEPKRVDATSVTIERKLLPRYAYELIELSYSVIEFIKLSIAVVRFRPDALYERANLYMLSGVWIAKLFNLPYLLEVNAPLAMERGQNGGLSWPRLAAWSECACWRAASVVLPVTAVLADEVKRRGATGARMVVTRNGVDLEKFLPTNSELAKISLGLPSGPVLGFVGYVREWHGLDLIVSMMAERPCLSKTILLIVGDGPARPGLLRLARKFGISDRLHFTGIAKHEALPRIISAFDIALQPEVTAYASPLKLFEYMALGRAIVAPARSNILEILENGVDGLLYSPGDNRALADALDRLISDPELRARLGAAAARKIVEFDMTWRSNARRVVSLIKDSKARALAL